MEEKSLGSGVGTDSGSVLDGPHADRRRRAHEILSAQESFLDRLEADLAEQLQQLASEVRQSVQLAEAAAGNEGETAALAAMRAQLESLQQQLAALDTQCDELRRQNEQARLEQARVEQELRVREKLLSETQGRDEQRRVELAEVREQLADLQAQLTASRGRQAALEQEIEAERERFEEKQEETKAQRRRIAREFKQQHAARLAEFDERKRELEKLAEYRNHDLQAKLQALEADLQRAAEEHAREIADLRSIQANAADSNALRELQAERDRLARQLAEAEEQLAHPPAGEGDARKRDDLQRRFEMAVEEVRELKRTNAELENKLKNRGGAAATGGSPALGGGLNWEAQKQRLLASLEADADQVDPDDEDAREERLNIEGTIRITDQIVAQKDREIAELREQLEQGGGTSAASRSQAVAELLDSDEIIRQEREKLAQLQAEWRQKIGEAEIEISVQRAKLARERAEIDERLRQLQADQDSRGASDEPSEPGKPARGRWLARLGLKDLDEQK